ncbi:MAG: hypothetical protein GTO17_10540 [Candidatus Aminicenantes bacterium]|nr:hypothetical protein [Candidatus Aminicenantes bacterium]
MKKIIATLVMVSFLLMSCAHTSQPYKVPANDEIKRLESTEEGTPDTELDKAKPKKKSRWDLGLGPLGGLLMILALLAIPVAAIYGMQRSLDRMWD